MPRRPLTAAIVFALAALLLTASITPLAAATSSGTTGRWLKIRVYEDDAKTPSVLVNLPMGLVSAFLRLAGHSHPHATVTLSGDDDARRFEDVDIDMVIRQLETMDPGQIIEVQDGSRKVSIWIE